MSSLINKQLLLTAYAYLFIMEQQKSQQGSAALQVESKPSVPTDFDFKVEVYAGHKLEMEWDHFIVASILDKTKHVDAEVRLKLTNIEYQGGKKYVTILRNINEGNINDSSSSAVANNIQRFDRGSDGWAKPAGLEDRLTTYMTAALPTEIGNKKDNITLVHTANTTISLPQENLSLRDVLVEKLLPLPNHPLLVDSVKGYDLLDKNCITFSAAVYQYLNERCQKEFSGRPLAPWEAKSFAATVTQAQFPAVFRQFAREVVNVFQMLSC